MPQVAIMATGAWYDPSNDPDAPERHGNPNVLTLDIGTSKLSQGPSALSVLVDVERWSGSRPDVQAFLKPLATAG
jgi:biotin/methionine sulfoxide reductase